MPPPPPPVPIDLFDHEFPEVTCPDGKTMDAECLAEKTAEFLPKATNEKNRLQRVATNLRDRRDAALEEADEEERITIQLHYENDLSVLTTAHNEEIAHINKEFTDAVLEDCCV